MYLSTDANWIEPIAIPMMTAASASPIRRIATGRGGVTPWPLHSPRYRPKTPQPISMYWKICGCGRQLGEADGQRDCRPRPPVAVPDAAHEQHQDERKNRAHVQLAVVTRRDVRRDRPGHEIRKSADQRRREPEPDTTQEQVCQPSGEKQVDDEQPRHRHVRAHEKAEQHARRVENVAVHRADVRHPPEQIRVPLREVPRPRQHLVSEVADRVATECTGRSSARRGTRR